MKRKETIEMFDDKTNERPLTVDEACAFMGMRKSTLYKMTHQKMILHYKPNGKLIYFKKSDLVSWMLRNPVKSENQIDEEASNYLIRG